MIGIRAMLALSRRELIRQVRQPTRIIASIATPLLIWLFIVGGFAGAVGEVGGGRSSLTAYTIPGMASLTVMFASIFASISLIQDRHEGVLRAAMVSPAPGWSIALSKVGAGSVLALLQGLVVLLALPVLGVPLSVGGVLGAVIALGCVSAALIGLGLALAWIVDSTQGFHGVMNALLMPMWLLSGAVFPVEEAAGWMRVITLLNPLSWAHSAMRGSLGMSDSGGMTLAWSITLGFAIFGVLLGTWTISRSRQTR